MSPAIVSVSDRHPALSRTPVPIDPRLRPATVGEPHAGATTLEIVPLLAVEDGEKFAIVQPIQFAADAPITVDEPGIGAQIEERSPHAGLAQVGRRAGEPPV